MSNEKYKKEVDRLIKVVKSEYAPEKIILFGSYVSGKITKHSDVDFFIVKKTTMPRIERQRKVSSIIKDRKIPVDIIVLTPKEFQNRAKIRNSFVYNIVNTGKLVYEKK